MRHVGARLGIIGETLPDDLHKVNEPLGVMHRPLTPILFSQRNNAPPVEHRHLDLIVSLSPEGYNTVEG